MSGILSNTRLDREQRSLLDLMISSGDLVLQLINGILDLSKVESGVMKLEATKFRPREVVKHVLQAAASSLQEILTSEGHIADDVPIEKPEGHVGIKLYVIPEPPFSQEELHQKSIANQSTTNAAIEENHHHSTSHTSISDQKGFHGNDNEPGTPVNCGNSMDGDSEEQPPQVPETTVWIRCDVYDTGIENALPTLFKQVSADHVRKYVGTGLGLAICKYLLEVSIRTTKSQIIRTSRLIDRAFRSFSCAEQNKNRQNLVDLSRYNKMQPNYYPFHLLCEKKRAEKLNLE